MRSHTLLVAVLFLAIATACSIQIFQVFRNRYDAGDVFQPYSTFRADPMGTSALFAALDALPGIEALRNTDDLTSLEAGKRTLVITSATRGPDTKETIDALDRFVAGGGVLVAAFNLGMRTQLDSVEDADPDAPEEDAASPAPESIPLEEEGGDDTEAEDQETRRNRYRDHLRRAGLEDIEDRWGFDIALRSLPTADPPQLPSVTVQRSADADASLPDSLAWRAPGYFDDLAEHWSIIYARDELPVLIERRYPGGGAILLATDRYFLSNEALREDRQTALLTWLFTRHPQVLFDETHLGTARPTFVMTLVKRYRLHGVLGVFALLALLYIWQNASSLVPRKPAVEEDRLIRTQLGQNGDAALLHLLRRTVSHRQLLRTCVTEWRQSAPRDPATQHCASELARMAEENATDGETSLAMRYRELCEIVAKRRTGGGAE